MKTPQMLLCALCFAVTCHAGDAPKDGPKEKPLIEDRRFTNVDGIFEKAEYIDLNTNSMERLYIRYGPISDSGVELERTKREAVVWRVHVAPLGVEHSKYTHHVRVLIENGKILVNSMGARRIFEWRDLESGQLISREVTAIDSGEAKERH